MRSDASALNFINDDYGSDTDCDDSDDTSFDSSYDASNGMNSLFQTSPFLGTSSPFTSPFSNGLNAGGMLSGYGASPFGSLNSYLGGGSSNGTSQNSVVAQLHNVLSQIASMLPSAVNGTSAPFNQDRKFDEFHGSSVGDPHDAFSGKTAGKQSVDDHWDDMRSHQDLLHSNSFNGGIRVATQTTQPDANGKTMNGKVTVHLNNERDAVSLDANGNAVLSQNGHWKSLAPGASVSLADGSTITEGDDHSLSIRKKNDQADMTTILKTNGDGGVDVNVDGKNARVGGYLARHAVS